MSILEKLLGASKKKVQGNQEALDLALKEKLKVLVYEEELVEELLPTFKALQGVQGFDVVLDLLESKERQIEAITGGDWFKQDTNPDDKNEEAEQDEATLGNLVDDILSKKYKD